nr:uncharacterized protein LOC109163501 [Ipomoea batatas]
MRQYKETAEGLLGKFQAYEIDYVPRAENSKGDILSKIKLGGLQKYLNTSANFSLPSSFFPSKSLVTVAVFAALQG